MAVILGEIYKLYHHLNDDISDPRTKNWFIMSNPFPGLAILGVYLYTVFRLGPKLMESRKPYGLRTTLILYNVVQIVACVYIVYKSIAVAWGRHYSFICQPVDTSDNAESMEMAWNVCYGYFLIKLADLLDTLFFVMRKKQKQVTFLHVYHHAGMVCLSWSIVKWLPGGHGSFIIIINSAVHVVMYAYYLLTVYDPIYKQSVWWKKHVTQMQILQFAILFFHFVSVFLKDDCRYPKFPSVVLIPQNLFMVILFSDFYRRAYMLKPKNIQNNSHQENNTSKHQ